MEVFVEDLIFFLREQDIALFFQIFHHVSERTDANILVHETLCLLNIFGDSILFAIFANIDLLSF